jgi:hypothetical protein
MLNLPARYCCLLLAVSLFAAPSALAAPALRHDTSRAARHPHHHKNHGHKSHQGAGRSKTARVVLAGNTSALVSATPTLLGDEAVERQRDYLNPGQAEAFRFQALASGETGSLHLYVDSGNRARTVVVGVYTNANGHPGALLSTGSASSVAAGSWNTVSVSQSSLASGSTYWIAILGEGGALHFRDRGNGPCPSESSAQTGLGKLPAAWSTGPLYADCPVSAYVSAGPSLPAELPKEESTLPVESPPPPPPVAPSDMTSPAITGSAMLGHTLKTSSGTWTGSPSAYTYKWQDCNTSGASCSNIGGATSTTYTLASRDVGHRLRAVVTATNEGGSATATSPATAAVAEPPAPPAETSPPPAAPTNTALPAISGTDTEGDTLKATSGSWTGSPTGYTYKWQDCDTSGASCSNINGATANSYTLGSGDVGDTLRVVVSATNEGGSSTATSAATATVEAPPVEPPPPPPPPAAPTNTTLPAISGTTTQGQTLSASTGKWTGSPTAYTYKWQDCNASGASCSNIAGAAAKSYTLGSSDVGDTLRVVVSATNEGGSTPATSPATAPIAAEASESGGGSETGGGSGGGSEAGEPSSPPSPACTQTVSSVSSAASAASAAAAGSAICLTAGSYGHLSVSGKHSGNVTIEPVPGASVSLEGASVASNSSYITIHDFSIGGGVNMGYGDSHITIDHNDINGQAPGAGGEGVEGLTVNCSAPNAPSYSGCTTTAPDSYITINGNQIHGYGMGGTEDAIHLNNWEHITITANDIYNLEEHGNHTDAMQSVFGGHYMTFAYNYEHDNQAQGFFIKDGDASEVTVNENLFVRNNNEPELYPGGEYNIQVFNTTGFTAANNTVWDGQDDILRAEGAAEALTANFNHNVEQDLAVLHEGGGPAYTLTEDYDIFKEAPWTFTKGAHSKVEAKPDFVNPAGEDYELASNPNDIGVSWQPSEYVYGPTGD